MPHVIAVAPVVTQTTISKSLEVLYGIDLKSFDAVTGGFHYLAGGPFQGPYDMLIDDLQGRLGPPQGWRHGPGAEP